ncbi:phosphoribosylformylglycinamidine synthase subunit PurS [Phycisphaerales bacterium AB-hyl4]|uniref:Phosphoribosylformylglycinamidine synthase subunit PurL n=1 Tax=Natronomicrosphaera hydrolytica TaxID=3242702 RepID=A0ABV4UAH8_9BACT
MTATPTTVADSPAAVSRVFRFEVRAVEGQVDPHAETVHREAASAFAGEPSVERVLAARVYLIEAAVDGSTLEPAARELLGDPVAQAVHVGVGPTAERAATVEVHYQPGVMDPVAQSTREALVEALPSLSLEQVDVRTGWRFDLVFAEGAARPSEADLRGFAERALANPVIQEIHLSPFHPDAFPHGHAYKLHLTNVNIRDLDDAGLMKLSREGHLFLSLDEMQAIQHYYREADREPTDIELETLAQTWSEHCVHKTLKATIDYKSEIRNPKSDIRFEGRPGHEVHEDGTVTIHNLLKSTVAAATHELMSKEPHSTWCVSVFEDNAGIVRFDDEDGVCIKVETHNHPSAIEPYGGAATGIGGCIRDILGTGLAAMPIANTNTFAVAPPDTTDLPRGVIHPKRVLQQVVAGVRDYGNRMGIPTVNGSVYFHNDYLGNPLVFAGCIGLIPLDKCFGSARPGDRIIALGGATGRDGIHGATFSSAELTDTHADEFSHAVQIGNPITQKKTADVILKARDWEDGPLFSAITDCGAGGFSSAVGEMGEKVGAYVELEKAPLKYAGLSYTEIWISEAQERMVLAVPAEKVDTLRALCESEDVGFSDLGAFGCGTDGATHEQPDEPTLILTYEGTQVGQLTMHLLHDGIPTPTRQAEWGSQKVSGSSSLVSGSGSKQLETRNSKLETLLSHPNIASKHWIVRQYDHEVQGGSVVKPLVGPEQDGPSDGAVVRPKLDSRRGVALASGMAPHLSEKATGEGLAVDGDSYWATLAAIDEAVRNAVCVGADPARIAILDNFCWPKCDDPQQLGSLVRAAEACYDGAMAYRTPFVSGKDSLSNQFTTDTGRVITIPPTLLVTAMGIVDDVARSRTMDAKAAGNALLIVGQTSPALGGSHYTAMGFANEGDNLTIPRLDLKQGPRNARAVASLIADGLIASAHDCSDGGLLVAAAEMAFAGRIGLQLDLTHLPVTRELDIDTACYAETPSRYLLEVSPAKLDQVLKKLLEIDAPFAQIGTFNDSDQLTVRTDREGQTFDATLDELRNAWLAPLDW